MSEPRIIDPNIITARPPRTPLCKGTCMGTDRPVWDSPAKLGELPDGQKVYYCTCCEFSMLDMGPSQAPNILAGFARKTRLMRCENCGYDVQVLPAVKELQ